MTTQLTPSQQQILDHAAQTTSGKIEWFPDNIKGGARKKVLDSLCNRALITPLGDDWLITAEAYDALGLPRPRPVTVADPEIEAAVTAIEAKASAEAKAPRTRANSKQATVIGMLKRPEGATIPQICEATGWQAHTVRGTFAGAFKKQLGLNLESTKGEGDRVYRIAG
jgi:hypothetical protein